MLSIKKTLAAAVLLMLFAQVKGQDKVTLRIGDPAPAIKYSKWLKGEPVTSFKGDQIYILEFWATWCGVCIKLMPHLTELQKQYKGKVTIISVNLLEPLQDGQLYESALPKVEKFVRTNSVNMGFSVMADNNDQHMRNNWHFASGHTGLPATYIIKDEKLIWMGSPMALDSILPKIFNGSYDMAAFKAKGSARPVNQAKGVAETKQEERRQAERQALKDAEVAKDYKKALQLLEKLEAKDGTTYDIRRFKILLKMSEKDAISFGNEWHNSDLNKPMLLRGNAVKSIEDAVAANDSLSKSTYLWAGRIYEEHYSNHYKFSNHPMIIERVASLSAKGGDYRKAIALQQKAIEGIKAFLAKNEDPHLFTEDLLIQYEETLARYMENHITQYKEALAGYKKVETTEANLENDSIVNRRKFKLLLKLNEKDAISFGNEWHKSLRNEKFIPCRQAAAKTIEMSLAKDDTLSKSTYLWAGRLYEEGYSIEKKTYTPMIMVKGASLYARGGDYQKAIALQQKAIGDAKAILANPETKKIYAGHITETIVTEYEEALGEYKAAGKAAKK